MAKNKQTQDENELGGLPPELMVDGQEQKTPPVAEEENQDTLPEQDIPDDLIAFVVLKGQTVHHDGKKYSQFEQLILSSEDADRLIVLGVVADVNKLRQQALVQHGPTVTVNDGVKISHEA